jgi:hypothetical protein
MTRTVNEKEFTKLRADKYNALLLLLLANHDPS